MVVTFEATGFLAAGAEKKKRDTHPLSDLPHLLTQGAWAMFDGPDSPLHGTGSLPTRAQPGLVGAVPAGHHRHLLCFLLSVVKYQKVPSASARSCSSRIKT